MFKTSIFPNGAASLHKRLFSFALAASFAAFAALAQSAASGSEDSTSPDDDGVIYEAGVLEVVNTQANPEVQAIIEKARPIEPGAIPTPKFTVRTRNNKFMLTIGGKILPIFGYDIGNNLYDTQAGLNFIPDAIPVPALTGHKSDFFFNALNSNIDFTVVGFAGTSNQVTGYVKLGTSGNSKQVLFKRLYLTWRNVTAGLRVSNATDEYAVQPPTIDTQGPAGALNTVSYQIAYKSPSYNGFRFAVSAELPSFYSSSGIYRGKDYRSWVGHKVNSEVDQLVPDIPMWVEYQKSPQNRIRVTAILRHFFYQDMLRRERNYVFAWGTMLSGNFSFWKPLTFYCQAAFGKGIGNYIQDLAGLPLSFTPKSDEPGRMEANPMMGLMFGASYNATSRLQFNAMWSMARIWNVGDYATHLDGMKTDANGDAMFSAGASNYRYGTYIAANCFYNITSYLQVGLEYIYGRRNTYFMGNATDSRIQTQLALTF